MLKQIIDGVSTLTIVCKVKKNLKNFLLSLLCFKNDRNLFITCELNSFVFLYSVSIKLVIVVFF
jgi:hypothetical protein